MKTKMTALLAVAGALTLAALSMPAAARSVEKIVDYRIGEADYRGYVYYDDAVKQPLPLVVMVPNWLGTNADNREQAREIAARDYVVFVADMYGRDRQPADAAAAGQAVRALYGDRPELRRRAKAAKDEAVRYAGEARIADTSKVAVIGFCFGGGTALELARTGEPLAATVSFHGNLAIAPPERNLKFRTRILALHGDADPYVPADQIDPFLVEMRSSGVDWELVRFGGAVHSFTDKKANQPGQSMYDAKAARRAFALMHDFLAEAFAAGVPG
ncbi:dienelactone hydrolase family protein [Solimonas flava]|uniref:dienelactone hydrolase family protein n=1 Tax=Solimonas flava TaxID=415849 RepID=UPI000409D2F9|nr:dienelactone hydrolase family protein [Solimonas flava]